MTPFQALLDQLTAGLDNQQYTLDQTSERVCRHIQAELGCTQVSVWMLETLEGGPFLRHRIGYDGPADRVLLGDSMVSHPNVMPYVAELTRQGVFASDDALADERLGSLREEFLAPLDLRSVLYATIGANGSTTSLLCCAERGRTRHWTGAEIRKLKGYADAISLRRARRRMREAEVATLGQRLLADPPPPDRR